MAEYEKKLLTLLVEKYRKSRKDLGVNVINRRTSVSPAELYKKYSRNDGDLDQIEAVNRTVEKCAEKGYLTFEVQGFSNEIARIYLADQKVEEIERYLEAAYQYESKDTKRRYVERMIDTYGRQTPAARRECERLKAVLDSNRIPKNYLHTEEVLKALVFIERNQTPMYVREASIAIYGSSKYLEENTLEPVCQLLRTFLNVPCEPGEMPDEILGRYHIIKEKQKLCLKGDLVLRIAGQCVELRSLRDGIEFFADDLNELEKVTVRTEEFMTVENRTAYFRCRKPGTSFFYLGGYVSRYQRDFLKKVYEDNPRVRYLHFGDIDAGGFLIHEHLCRASGIPFGLYGMSAEVLRDERFRPHLRKLTGHDRERLEGLARKEPYRETVRYMLEEDAKLEQEIVACEEFSGSV